MPRNIISIYGRAETGISRPFLCESDSGQSFFVKRGNVSWDQLVLEFVIGNLASDYGLPVAPFELLNISQLLARHTLTRQEAEFEAGTAFGSPRIPFAEELRESHLRHIPNETKIAIFCFDWWTRNSDRRLNLLGSSPNLLWDPMMHSVVVIDHDRCLDPDFDGEEFKKEHAFRDVRPFIEKGDIERLRTKFDSAIYSLKKIWAGLPEDWLVDESGTPRARLSIHDVEAALLKPKLPVDGILPG